METTELTREQQLIAGLRELADFLKDHPEMKTYSHVGVYVHTSSKDEFLAQVARLGDGVKTEIEHEILQSTKRFGAQVSLQVFGRAEEICERVETTETVTTTGWAIPSELAGA